MEDDCVECDQDWSNGKRHIDLWVGGEGGDSSAVIDCEDALTQDSADVVVNPPSDEPVDTTPLFDSDTNTCYDPGSFGGGGGYPSGYQLLVDQNSGHCVDIYGDSLDNGAEVDAWSCKSSGQANQEFRFNPVSNGYGELQAESSGKDIVVQYASTAAGAPVIQYTQNGTTNGLWLPMQLSDGTWQFKNQNSGLCLDVSGASTSAGAPLVQWYCKSSATGTNQAFATR